MNEMNKLYGIKELRDGLTLDEIEEKHPWILVSNIESAILGKDRWSLVWYDGIWRDGTWKEGIWENGIWYEGAWEGGLWKDGTWEGGLWESGIWEDGIWGGGVWEKGEWRGGTWKKGEWRGGTWRRGEWRGGTWEKGAWRSGTWEKGVWHGGYDGDSKFHSEKDSPDKWRKLYSGIPRRYRKKPVVIEAIQWVWENWDGICDFVPVPDVLYVPKEEEHKERPVLRIRTLEGEMLVQYEDWIIKGVRGEYYLCKSDIFQRTYEEVSVK